MLSSVATSLAMVALAIDSRVSMTAFSSALLCAARVTVPAATSAPSIRKVISSLAFITSVYRKLLPSTRSQGKFLGEVWLVGSNSVSVAFDGGHDRRESQPRAGNDAIIAPSHEPPAGRSHRPVRDRRATGRGWYGRGLPGP